MDGIALVLAGGGGKGAYHIGVWKALKAFGIDDKIKGVSGTSVGSLNAALLMQGDYKRAEQVWLSISHQQLLPVSPSTLVSALIGLGLSRFYSMARIAAIANTFSSQGIFSRSGMVEIMKEYLDFKDISDSKMLGFATCCKLPFIEKEYFALNDCPVEQLPAILLSSSALPVIYGAEKVNGHTYIDGGLRDNLPIDPLYKQGFRQLIVVHLNRQDTIDRRLYPDANIIEIIPANDQGNLLKGTLDFSPEGARRRMEAGYRDTMHILESIFAMGTVQQGIDNSLHQILEDEHQFSSDLKGVREQRVQLKSQLNEWLD